MYADWQSKFGVQLGKNVVMLTGETSADLKLLAKVSLANRKGQPSYHLQILLNRRLGRLTLF